MIRQGSLEPQIDDLAANEGPRMSCTQRRATCSGSRSNGRAKKSTGSQSHPQSGEKKKKKNTQPHALHRTGTAWAALRHMRPRLAWPGEAARVASSSRSPKRRRTCPPVTRQPCAAPRIALYCVRPSDDKSRYGDSFWQHSLPDERARYRDPITVQPYDTRLDATGAGLQNSSYDAKSYT
ncbi:hypothetical protein VTN02DRAFT_412 [Thermoascus thermophilus]